jgi:hypothetical protein
VPAELTLARQPAQVGAGRLGDDHQRQGAGVGRHHHVVTEAALEPQAGHAEGAVLVVLLRVGLVVAGLRDPPRHAPLAAVRDLPLDHRQAGLIEQRSRVARHDQHRHEVLEHRAAPRQQRRASAGRGELPAEAEPVLLRQLALRDGDEARQARLGGEQIVIAAVELVIGDPVADGHEVPLVVVEQLVVEVGELAAARRQEAQLADPRRRALGGQRHRGPQPFVLERGHELLQARGLAEGERLVEPRVGRRGQRDPGRHVGELLEGAADLGLEGVRPPGGLGDALAGGGAGELAGSLGELRQQPVRG